jgi:hypothetical protein
VVEAELCRTALVDSVKYQGKLLGLKAEGEEFSADYEVSVEVADSDGVLVQENSNNPESKGSGQSFQSVARKLDLPFHERLVDASLLVILKGILPTEPTARFLAALVAVCPVFTIFTITTVIIFAAFVLVFPNVIVTAPVHHDMPDSQACHVRGLWHA